MGRWQDDQGGRWEKRVMTADGEVVYRSAPPVLLSDLQTKHKPAATQPRAALQDFLRIALEPGNPADLGPGRVIHSSGFGGGGDTWGNDQAKTPEVRAMELVEASRNVSPRRQLQMFREAIALDADCTWALLAMARRFSDD